MNTTTCMCKGRRWVVWAYCTLFCNLGIAQACDLRDCVCHGGTPGPWPGGGGGGGAGPCWTWGRWWPDIAWGAPPKHKRNFRMNKKRLGQKEKRNGKLMKIPCMPNGGIPAGELVLFHGWWLPEGWDGALLDRLAGGGTGELINGLGALAEFHGGIPPCWCGGPPPPCGKQLRVITGL